MRRGWLDTVLRLLAIVVIGVVLLYGLGLIFLLRYSLSLARGLSEATGLDAKVVAGLSGILAAGLLWLFGRLPVFPARPWLRRFVTPLIVFYLVGAVFSISQYYVSGSTHFDPKTGKPVKYCIKTLQGFKCSSTAGFDPALGVEYQPITSALAEEMMLWRRTQAVTAPAYPDNVFFDPLTGKPIKWYFRTPSDEIEIFSLPGYHPRYGEVLRPVTRDVVLELERQQKKKTQERRPGEEGGTGQAVGLAVKGDSRVEGKSPRQEAERRMVAASPSPRSLSPDLALIAISGTPEPLRDVILQELVGGITASGFRAKTPHRTTGEALRAAAARAGAGLAIECSFHIDRLGAQTVGVESVYSSSARVSCQAQAVTGSGAVAVGQGEDTAASVSQDKADVEAVRGAARLAATDVAARLRAMRRK